MQINIEKIKLENDQAEVQEKIQETELYYQDQMLELKKLQLKQQKDAKLIKLLTDKKNELKDRVEELEKQLAEGSESEYEKMESGEIDIGPKK